MFVVVAAMGEVGDASNRRVAAWAKARDISLIRAVRRRVGRDPRR